MEIWLVRLIIGGSCEFYYSWPGVGFWISYSLHLFLKVVVALSLILPCSYVYDIQFIWLDILLVDNTGHFLHILTHSYICTVSTGQDHKFYPRYTPNVSLWYWVINHLNPRRLGGVSFGLNNPLSQMAPTYGFFFHVWWATYNCHRYLYLHLIIPSTKCRAGALR